MKPPVEAPTSAHARPATSTRERVERVLQLLPAARDEARRPLDLELRVVRKLLARLVVPRNEPGEHERLRLGARLREAAFDEKDVEALLRQPARLDDRCHDLARPDGRSRASMMLAGGLAGCGPQPAPSEAR